MNRDQLQAKADQAYIAYEQALFMCDFDTAFTAKAHFDSYTRKLAALSTDTV